MFQSVRARLALWHTAVLAVLLTGFALAAYVFLERATAANAEEYLASAASAFATELTAEREDARSDTAAALAAAGEFRVRDLGVLVFDAHGRRVAASTGGPLDGAPLAIKRGEPGDEEPPPPLDTAAVRRVAMRPGLPSGNTGGELFTIHDPEGGYRVAVMQVPLAGEAYRIAMVQSRHAEEEMLESARLACLVAIPIVLLAAGLGGSFLAKHSLAPVAAMSERAAQISTSDLSERLPVVNPRDELGQLALVLNDLLARVDHSLEQQRRFMADASHELRTPVSIIRAAGEVALDGGEARTQGEYRESLRIMTNTAARLSTIVNELFLLARADAGQQPLRRTELYLDELVGDCVRAVRALALRSGIVIRADTDVDAPFTGDEELLRRLVTNLLDNAVKYSGPGSTVSVTFTETIGAYRLSVRDTGPGIPVEAQSRLFERFFRADPARSRAAAGADLSGGGAGLGLAIAQWIAGAHGGRLELADSSPAGTEFVLWLPRNAERMEEPSSIPDDAA